MPRPREFDEHRVLDAAADCFWSHGYEGTSTRQLTQAMALTPASLYNAFGDKRALFRRALDHYLEQTLHDRVRRLEAMADPALAVTRFFVEIIDRSVADPGARGCFLVNSALEAGPRDPAMRAVVDDEIRVIETFFHGRVTRAGAAGSIPPEPAPAEAAAMLTAVLLGIRVLARLGPGRDRLSAAAAPVLTLLGLPPLPAAAETRP
ncbi:MAG: TetR/AcrR family transcriptional regulator [Ferrovibrionaceae bacterium]